jgi:hypothetical protein
MAARIRDLVHSAHDAAPPLKLRCGKSGCPTYALGDPGGVAFDGAAGAPAPLASSRRRITWEEGALNQNGARSRQPLRDVSRSRSGRVPQWVIDEAQGRRLQHSGPWRGGYPSARTKASQRRRRRRQRWSSGLAKAVTALAIVGAAGWMQAHGVKPQGSNGFMSQPSNLPRPGHEESEHPLGVPAPLAFTSSSYRFMAYQAEGTTPVAYDPCRPIHYVIRHQGEPAGGQQIITDAVLSVSEATGLRFAYDGATSEAPSRARPSYQPKRYGDRWAPVLISWVTPQENPDFAADVAGQGGSASVGLPGQPSAYVTGAVELDSGQMANILQRPEGDQIVRAIVLHELGHLVGLGHVTDASQLMYPQTLVGVTDFGDGDLTGLGLLGKGACLPDV